MIFSTFLGFCKNCFKNAKNTYEDCVKFYRETNCSEQELKYCKDVRKDLFLKCPKVCYGINVFAAKI